MSESAIAAVVYSNGIYPDKVMDQAIEPLRTAGLSLAGVLQVGTVASDDCHPCDMLLQELASGDVHAIAEDRGREARGCRLDVGLLTEIGESVLQSLYDDARLLVVNKFGKIEADGGGLRQAICEAVGLGIPVLVGVPARNLDRWRAFAVDFAVELAPDASAIRGWLSAQGLPLGAAAGSSPRAVHAG